MGKLVQVATETVTSAVGSIDFGGAINSDDVYMLAVNGFIPSTDAEDFRLRVTESGTQNSTANYDASYKTMRTDTTFNNGNYTNLTYLDVSTAIGTDTGEQFNCIMYIYNAYNSSEYTFFTFENTQLSHTALLIGNQGGGVFTSSSQVDGLLLFTTSGNIASGTFTLYKVV